MSRHARLQVVLVFYLFAINCSVFFIDGSLSYVSSYSHHTAWAAGVQHNRRHTCNFALSGHRSATPRDYLDKGVYLHYNILSKSLDVDCN